MKNITQLFTALVFISFGIFQSCNTPAQKVENAKEDVADAKEDLAEANEEYLNDVEEFRRQSQEKIAENERSIALFNARIQDEKDEAKAEYKLKIVKLEAKNSDLKKKMADYKIEGKEKWEEFKAEFSRDMDELGAAFRDLTVKNN
jgi:cell shape-determining protein MreC